MSTANHMESNSSAVDTGSVFIRPFGEIPSIQEPLHDECNSTLTSATKTTITTPTTTSGSSRRSSIASTLLGRVTGLLHHGNANAQLLPTAAHSNVSVATATPAGGPVSRTHLISKSSNNHTNNTSKVGNTAATPNKSHLPCNALLTRTPSPSRAPRTSFSRDILSSRPSSARVATVKETNRVYLEYDPRTKRRVLNTYEILREIGKGEHGKVKLARDLEHNELVAIKIVNRKSKKERPRFKRREPSVGSADGNQDLPSRHPPSASALGPGLSPGAPIAKKFSNEYELKVRREIAIMKKCNHNNIVQLKEVLDDISSHKIYMVLEYLEKGEIKWKRKTSDIPNSTTSGTTPVPINEEIPCNGSNPLPKRKPSLNFNYECTEDDDDILLLDMYTPNLTFRQSRKILRDVLIGLEYLHMQGIVHRDIKPANLLVSSDNVVKISDFGVSFASSLDIEDGVQVSEMELAKTAGTPAFFAPELCQTNNLSPSGSTTSVKNIEDKIPKVDHKIDIWALGVTLYCLLFGKVPFNADSEFELFEVIVNESLVFPESLSSFNSPETVTPEEFELAKDLLTKLLNKDRGSRIDIPEIKTHPFVLMDLEDDPELIKEFLDFNSQLQMQDLLSDMDMLVEDIDNAIIGIGSRIKKNIAKALRLGKSDANANLDDEDSTGSGSAGTGTSTGSETPTDKSTMMKISSSDARSIIVSESLKVSSPPENSTSRENSSGNLYYTLSNSSGHNPHVPSNLSQQTNSEIAYLTPIRTNHFIQDVIDLTSASSSRRGSITPVEAPMVETKRNVGGDLYLKNQTALEAFKGIQKQDEKRRKSSAFTSPPTSSIPTMGKTSFSCDEYDSSSSQPIAQPTKVGPISIENNTRHIFSDKRSNSVISLPLNESFASLDSFSDDYLAQKYVRTNGNPLNGNRYRRRSSSTSQLESGFLEANGDNFNKSLSQINEKLNNFDLGSLMKPKNITFDLSANTEADDIEPTTKRINCNRKSSVSSYSSYSSTSSSESDSEEEGNLTLAFASKVPSVAQAPHFLTANNRAKSHDSHLPRLAQHSANIYDDFPSIFSDNMAAFEDVPAGLITEVPGQSTLNESSGMRPTVSILSSNTSSATVTPGYKHTSPQNTNSTLIFGAGPISGGKNNSNSFQASLTSSQLPVKSLNTPLTVQTGLVDTPDRSLTPNSKFNLMQKEFYSKDRLASPLANNAPAADNATINSHLVAKYVNGDNKNTAYLNTQFNNHYKKEHVAFPFPNALHFDNDKESASKAISRGEARPQHYRSSSITVGFLQMNKSKDLV